MRFTAKVELSNLYKQAHHRSYRLNCTLMIHRLCAFLLAAFPALAFSQGLVGEKGFNESYRNFPGGVVSGSEGYFVIRSVFVENSFFFRVGVEFFDNQNNLISQNVLFDGFSPQSYEAARVTGIAAAPDGDLYLTVLTGGCDYMIDRKAVLLRISPEGTVSYVRTFGPDDTLENEWHENVDYSGLSKVPGGLLLHCGRWGQRSLLTLDDNGALTDSLALNTGTSYEGFASSTVWEAFGLAENRLEGIDANGNASPVHVFSSQISAFYEGTGGLFITTADSVFRIAADGTIADSALLQLSGAVKQLKVVADGVAYVQQDAAGLHLFTLDSQLDLQQTEQFAVEAGNLFADFSDGRFAVAASYELSDFEATRTLLFDRNSAAGIEIQRADAAVVAVALVDNTVQAVNEASNIYAVNMHLKATVRNSGSAHLGSVWLNVNLGQSFACNYDYYRAFFDGLSLAPGSETEIDLGYVGWKVSQFTPPALQSNLCVYSSFANGVADMNVANDQLCELFTHGFVGTEKNTSPEFAVFPNPSTGTFSIRSASEVEAAYTVTDMSGKLIRKGKGDLSEPLTLQLPAGIYMITLSGEKYSKTLKIAVN
jgi:hypothetical protein